MQEQGALDLLPSSSSEVEETPAVKAHRAAKQRKKNRRAAAGAAAAKTKDILKVKTLDSVRQLEASDSEEETVVTGNDACADSCCS